MHVARKQRVETYLKPETVEKLDQMDEPNSTYIRRAVNESLGVSNE